MSFFRIVTIKGHDYGYRVESYRTPDGKVRQRAIEYIGAVPQSTGIMVPPRPRT